MGSTGSAGHGTEPSPVPRLQNVGTPRATLGGHRVSPDRARAQKHPPNSLHCMPVRSSSIFNAQQHLFGNPDPGQTPNSHGAVPGHGAHARTWYPHHALTRHWQHPATPWHRRQPRRLLFRREFVFTITLLRDYSACGFLARPICFCSAAGGSLPSPKLHAGLYKRPRRLGCGEARAQPGSAAAQGRFR